MKILIASDKFKGSLTALEACEALHAGILEGTTRDDLEIRTAPLSDGGEGMARALTDASRGRWRTIEVLNAEGTPTIAGYGLSRDGKKGFVEMAEASGLEQLAGTSLDPWNATTYGTGQLVSAAIHSGIEELILGIGGSATNDGGAGMAHALGYQFLDASGNPISNLPSDLENAVEIKSPERPIEVKVTVACDVRNPLLGSQGATRVYGPQKGIREEDFTRHEARLAHLCQLSGDRGFNAAEEPGAGAAGGLGFGCHVFLDAKLESGFALVARFLGLESHVAWADLVLTGEGKIDTQSLEGKAPFGVAQMARKAGKPVAAFCGVYEPPEPLKSGEPDTRIEDSFGTILEIRREECSLEENLQRGHAHLRETASLFASKMASVSQAR